MATPMRFYALAAEKYGDVDPTDSKAVEDFFIIGFPALSEADQEEVMGFLLTGERKPHLTPKQQKQQEFLEFAANLPPLPTSVMASATPPIRVPSPVMAPDRGTVVGMNAKQRFPDLVKHIARVRGTTPEHLTEEMEQINQIAGSDIFAALDDVNIDVLQAGLTVPSVIASLKRRVPLLPDRCLDLVIVVYNYCFHGGALR